MLSALVQEQKSADCKQYTTLRSNIESLGKDAPARQGRPVAKSSKPNLSRNLAAAVTQSLKTTDLHKDIMLDINQMFNGLGTIRLEQGSKQVQALWNRTSGPGSKSGQRNPKIFSNKVQRQMSNISRNLKKQGKQVDAALIECKEAMKEERQAKERMAELEKQVQKRGRGRRFTTAPGNMFRSHSSSQKVDIALKQDCTPFPIDQFDLDSTIEPSKIN